MKTPNILVILAHPDISKSRINRTLVQAVKDLENVRIHDLYSEYPNFKINVKKEQELLVKADVVVFQFPFYWYSCPSLLKKWMDDVLEYGFAYGSKGTALAGKKFFITTSTGGPKEAYASDGYNHFTIDDLLRPFEQTANLTRMIYESPVVVHDARTIEDMELVKCSDEYRKRLAQISK